MKLLKSLFIIIISTVTIYSQSSSPFTRFGIGDVEYSYSARRTGFGGLGIAVDDVDFISLINPASINGLNRTRIEIGLNYNGLFMSDNNNKKFAAEFEFTGFTFAFPIDREYGISAALGVLPFSNVSYSSASTLTLSDGSVYKTLYEGTGGLSKIFVSATYKLPFNLKLGAGLDYYFGNINYMSTADFNSDDNLEAKYTKTINPKGVGGTFGLITPDLNDLFKLDNISHLQLGLSASVFSNLNADTIIISHSLMATDTLANGLISMNLPARINAGLSFVLSGNYLFTFDYSFQNWSEYEFAGNTSPNLANAYKLSTGFEFRPDRELGDGFWDQLFYRAGFSYEKTPYVINNNPVNQLSVSAGFSMPITPENTIDVSLQYAKRGDINKNGLSENILRLGLGISFGEFWFIRQDK